MSVEVYIRRHDRQVEGQVSGWSMVTYHAVRNDVGHFTIVTRSAADAQALSWVSGSPKGVIIRNEGVTIASGWIDPTRSKAVATGGITEWTFYGWDDTYLMAKTRVWPSPGNSITSQAAHRVITATRSNMIRLLFIENVASRLGIPGAVGGNDEAIGDVRTRRIRFTNLLEISQAIGGRTVNFAVRQRDSDNALKQERWAPVDKTLDVQFSPALGTVAGWTAEGREAEATRVVIAAGGELENRGLRLYVNNAEESMWGGVRKLEEFKDRRDLDITNPNPGDDWLSEAAEDAADFLEESRSRAGFVIDATGLGYSYGPDYMVGDKVRGYVGQDSNGQPVGLVDDLLEEATVTWSSEGERAQLRIGPTDWDPVKRREQRAREIGRRVAALETRY